MVKYIVYKKIREIPLAATLRTSSRAVSRR